MYISDDETLVRILHTKKNMQTHVHTHSRKRTHHLTFRRLVSPKTNETICCWWHHHHFCTIWGLQYFAALHRHSQENKLIQKQIQTIKLLLNELDRIIHFIILQNNDFANKVALVYVCAHNLTAKIIIIDISIRSSRTNT